MVSTEDPQPQENVCSEPPAEDETKTSALQDNIQRKGRNAYYFAHAHKATGPQWDGKPQPKLLSRSSSIESGFAGTRPMTPSSFDFSKSNITSYSFSDDGTNVKLYLALEGVGEQCTEDNATLEFTDKSFCFVLENYVKPGTPTADSVPPTPLCLSFGKLTADITKAKYKIKQDRIIITLVKADPNKVWHTINDKGTPDHEVV